jgi:hypothetical protein
LASSHHRPTTFRTTRTGAVVTAFAVAHAPPTQLDALVVVTERRNGPAWADADKITNATTARNPFRITSLR